MSPLAAPAPPAAPPALGSSGLREVLLFLAVGGTGYVADVGAFNVFRTVGPMVALDPVVAKLAAVAVAMAVTYLGNRFLTWRSRSSGDRRREVLLFVVFNVLGLGCSVVLLWVSHDLLGLTTRLEDNLSANVVGVALGTWVRFWGYRRFVFPAAAEPAPLAPTETYC